MAVPPAQFLQRFFLLSIVVSIAYTALFHYRYQQQHSILYYNRDSYYLEASSNDGSSSFQTVDNGRDKGNVVSETHQVRNSTANNIATKPSVIVPETRSPPTKAPTRIIPQTVSTTPHDNQTATINNTSATLPEDQPIIKYWRFDDAAPRIQHAKTHFLQSIPLKHRLPPNAIDNMTEYAALKTNRYPHKLHLFETNPCIAVLPERYRTMFATTFGNHQQQRPIYIAVYRVTHKNNCYDGQINLQLLGGTWEPTTTDYLGVALLNGSLEIVRETVVSVQLRLPESTIMYPDDYRIYNLDGRQLYLTSLHTIVPLYLRKTVDGADNDGDATNGNITKSLLRLSPAFPKVPQPFEVWIRNYTACAIYKQKGTSKNLLYFVSQDKDNTKSSSNNNVRVVHYPRHNPNDVRNIELDTPCGKQRITPFKDKPKGEWYPDVSYHTIDEQMFPNPQAPLWLRDRGSACCTKMQNPNRSNNSTVLVAVVHPKTMFPGRKLPPGVAPNTYLSRWIAFEPTHPYRIVARSGMFCLGYPSADADANGLGNATTTGYYQNPLAHTHMNPLDFAGVQHDCPRIHFVMGMVDKVDDDADSVLLSYGVSDCMSRIVEIRKADIHAMLWPSSKQG